MMFCAQGNLLSCLKRLVKAKRPTSDAARIRATLPKFLDKDEPKKYHCSAAYLQQAMMGGAALVVLVPTGYLAMQSWLSCR